MKRVMAAMAVLSTVVFVGCASSTPGPGDAGVTVERGPKIFTIEGDPNGLWWDDSSHTLYLADDNGNRILKWSDTGGFTLVKDLPAASPEGAGLGQLVFTADGTIVVTRFGYGTTGDVVSVSSSGDAKIVPGLDPMRRRIGLTVARDGKLFDSWFVRLATGARVGAVGELSLSGTEPEVITGLKKPVGVLAVGDDLFVSDQDLGQILKAPRSNPTAYMVFATVATPDLLAEGPDGSIFTGSTGGNLYRITASGEASVFASGFQEVRGIAYDSTNRRVFVADHDGDESNGVSHLLHILPVD